MLLFLDHFPALPIYFIIYSVSKSKWQTATLPTETLCQQLDCIYMEEWSQSWSKLERRAWERHRNNTAAQTENDGSGGLLQMNRHPGNFYFLWLNVDQNDHHSRPDWLTQPTLFPSYPFVFPLFFSLSLSSPPVWWTSGSFPPSTFRQGETRSGGGGNVEQEERSHRNRCSVCYSYTRGREVDLHPHTHPPPSTCRVFVIIWYSLETRDIVLLTAT